MARLKAPPTWSGRLDSQTDQKLFRFHQIIKLSPLTKNAETTIKSLQVRPISVIGFACDEGVTRNQGRKGAASGPQKIRQFLASLPAPFYSNEIFDQGDIECNNSNLEEAQSLLSKAVESSMNNGARSLVLGGGHETSLGHFQGIYKALSGRTVGIINIDAHFDLRDPNPTGHSGSPFFQISEQLKRQSQDFYYMCLGIQSSSNSAALFERACDLEVHWKSASEIHLLHKNVIHQAIEAFATNVDYLYLSVCLDAFGSAFAPGVSAPTPLGLMPCDFDKILEGIKKTKKLIAADIVELNPLVDINDQTSRLAAQLSYKLIEALQT